MASLHHHLPSKSSKRAIELIELASGNPIAFLDTPLDLAEASISGCVKSIELVCNLVKDSDDRAAIVDLGTIAGQVRATR